MEFEVFLRSSLYFNKVRYFANCIRVIVDKIINLYTESDKHNGVSRCRIE